MAFKFIYVFLPLLLFAFLILITDIQNAAGGIFIYFLIMAARFVYDKIKEKNKK
ncbi:hypothetical protein ACFPFV_04660 [Salinicoccus siamensis]|uniref:hypothetical protein n=1 Tax=Salinicoccus siamensis TaxID=381830 RepID=UPI00360EB855